MNCPNCRSKIPSGSEFCTKCGFKISATHNAEQMIQHPHEYASAFETKTEHAPEPSDAPVSTPAPSPMPTKPTFAASATPAAKAKAAAPPKAPRGAIIDPALMPFIQSKKIDMRGRLSDCMKLFEKLAEFDAMGDKVRTRSVTIGAIFGVLGAFSLFISLMFGAYVLIATAIFAAIAVPNLLRYSKIKKMDIVNDFRLTLVPLFEALEEDIDGKNKVSFKLDLSGATPEKVVSNRELDPKQFGDHVRKVLETVYRDPWCNVRIPLRDGCEVTLSIENLYFKYVRTQRGSSGKTKTKTKWKKRTIARAGATPAAEKYLWDEQKTTGQTAERKIKLLEKKGARVCRITRKFKYKPDDGHIYESPAQKIFGIPTDTPMDSAVAPREIFKMLMELLSMLKPAEARK